MLGEQSLLGPVDGSPRRVYGQRLQGLVGPGGGYLLICIPNVLLRGIWEVSDLV